MSSTLHPFAFEKMPVRGRLLRLSDIGSYVHTLKDAPATVAQMLAEMLAAAALLVHDAKHQASVNLQVQNVSKQAMAFAHCSREGHLKAYANEEMQKTDFATIGQQPDSHFAVTLDYPEAKQPYQSLVGLTKGSAAAALEHYFTTSVQTPTLLRVHTWHENGNLHAGAMFLQVLPGKDKVDEDDWHRLGLLLDTLQPEELANTGLEADQLLGMVFAEDSLRLGKGEDFTLQADDPRPRMLAALANVSTEELRQMLDEDGQITLQDKTSGESHTFTRADLQHLLRDEGPETTH